MQRMLVLAAVCFWGTGAMSGEIVTVPASASVPTVTDALEDAIRDMGGEVRARIPQDAPSGEGQLVIFTDPAISSAAVAADPRAGIAVPARVLVYRDADGEVLLAYEAPEDSFAGLNISSDADYVIEMKGALQRVTNIASIAQD